MISAVLFISFFVFLILGVPIALCLGLSSVCAILYSGTSLTIVATNMYSGISKFLLLAIPFFVLSGNIMAKAGISKRLVRFVDTCVGHKRGGIAIVCVIVACFFGAISGSGPATVAALGMIIIPAMVQAGYDKASGTALMSTAGAIGIIIPPSITFVIYGSITGTSVGSLFASGIVPGILMGVLLVVAMMWVSRKRELQLLPKATWKERWESFKDAFWGLMMPVIILGGIYGGIFTPTEAAAVSAIYGLFVGLFIYKTITFKDVPRILADSVSQTAVVMFIVGTASLFAWILTVTSLAAQASNVLISVSSGNKYIFLLIVNIILLIAGCFIDANSACYILVPILVPVATALGINPIHLGCIMIVNMAIGMVTPPVGVNLYVGCGIAKISLKEISIAVLPFIVASIAALLLTTYVPIISMFLPNLLG